MLKKVIAFLLIILLVVVLIMLFRNKEESNESSEYGSDLKRYFKEIALKSEYLDNPYKVIKWTEPMVLFVRKSEDFKQQMLTIKKTISKINELATDGFRIELTDNISKSNAVLFLCNFEQLADSAPFFYDIVAREEIDYNISGYAYTEYFTESCKIDKAFIFINSEEPWEVQKSTILEEITQSLGLANDSDRYSNSIFYKDKDEQSLRVDNYSEIDEEIVRFLYHPIARTCCPCKQVRADRS